MTTYTFDQQLVVDPTDFTRAPNSPVTVYDVNDTGNTTPLTLTDLNGLPLTNPLTSSGDAFLPAFQAVVAQVKFVSSALSSVIVGASYDAVLQQATDAQAAAAASASSAAQAASYAAGMLPGGTLDGGSASTTFTNSLNIDGGTANG